MKMGIQKELEMLGRYGCGFLCVCEYFGYSEFEILKKYREVVEKGIMTEDCFINSWEDLFNYLAPAPATFRVEKSFARSPDCDFYIEYWYNPLTKKHHFTLKDWDPYGFSETVKDGHIESYRNVFIKKNKQ